MLVEADNGRTVDVRPDQTIRITLHENATTGYRWAVDSYDGNILEAPSISPHYEAGAIGSGGEVALTFKAKAPGAGEIVLKHWRQWEGEASVTKRFRVVVNVRR
ncbi:MAG: protease inhibitor I42 family protein [Methylocystis sp.]|nr:protease inhibitor I42 family protein [Methylocystis sp.]